jgi:hypothetical protein
MLLAGAGPNRAAEVQMARKKKTSAWGLPLSKCRRNSKSRSISSCFQKPIGSPLSRMIVSCARNGLRCRSQMASRGPTELHTYLSEYQRRPRFQVT